MPDFSQLRSHLDHYGFELVDCTVSDQQLLSYGATRKIKLSLRYPFQCAANLQKGASVTAPKNSVAWYTQSAIIQQNMPRVMQLNLSDSMYAVPLSTQFEQDPVTKDLNFQLDMQLIETPPLDNFEIGEITLEPENKPLIRRPRKWI